jgi:hypothetical protein
MKRLKEGVCSMFKRMGSIVDSIHKFVWNLGPLVDEPFNPPREWYDNEGARRSSSRRHPCAVGRPLCFGDADIRCIGGNCTRHCVQYCAGRCIEQLPKGRGHQRNPPSHPRKEQKPRASDTNSDAIN